MNGLGLCTWVDGKKYAGSWLNNQMHGFGIYNYADGVRYEGWFSHDKKEGFGRYFWTDGRQYAGYWHKGKQHGIGTFIDKGKDKIAQFGMWEQGKRLKWWTPDEVIEINQQVLDVTPHF